MNSEKAPIMRFPFEGLAVDYNIPGRYKEIIKEFARLRNDPYSLFSVKCALDAAVDYYNSSYTGLLLEESLYEVVGRIMEDAKEKHGDTWKSRLDKDLFINAAGRHLLRLCQNEYFDKESGYPHLGHFAANLLILSFQIQTFPDTEETTSHE